MKQETTDEIFYLWVLLRRSSNAILRARAIELQKYKSSPIQAAVLRAIIERKGKWMTAGEIAEYLFRKNQTVSGLLNRMEANGLIKRKTDKDDNRIRRVMPTNKGKKLYEKIRHSEAITTIMSALSVEECEKFEKTQLLIKSKALEKIENS